MLGRRRADPAGLKVVLAVEPSFKVFFMAGLVSRCFVWAARAATLWVLEPVHDAVRGRAEAQPDGRNSAYRTLSILLSGFLSMRLSGLVSGACLGFPALVAALVCNHLCAKTGFRV